MNRLKTITSGLATILLLIVLVAGVPLMALSRTLTSQDSIAEAIGSQPVYDQLQAAADDLPLNQLGSEDQSTTNQVFFDRAAFEPLVDKYLNFDFYQRAVSSATNGVYRWLDGQTTTPQFSVVITDEPSQFKKLFIDILTSRYQSFAPCKADVPAELEQVFSLECRLPGVGAKQLRPLIERELQQSDLDKFINNATITSDEFVDNLSAADAARAQRLYDIAQLLPTLVIVSALVLLLLLALLNLDRQRIFKVLGWRLIIPALALIACGLLIRLGGTAAIGNLASNAGAGPAGFTNVGQAAAVQLLIKVANRWLVYSLLIALIGLLGIIAQRLINKQPLRLRLKRENQLQT